MKPVPFTVGWWNSVAATTDTRTFIVPFKGILEWVLFTAFANGNPNFWLQVNRGTTGTAIAATTQPRPEVLAELVALQDAVSFQPVGVLVEQHQVLTLVWYASVGTCVGGITLGISKR